MGDRPAAVLRHLRATAARTASSTCSSRTRRYAKQWKYTNAPDADARAVQAAYWAQTWAEAQGKDVAGRGHRGQGRQDGRLPALRDVRQVLQAARPALSPTCPAGTGKNAALPAVLVLRVGRRDRRQRRLVVAHRLQPQPLRLPEPARGLGAVQRRRAACRRCRRRRPPTGPPASTRQLEFYTWLQSAEGAIAGGATNSWDGNYATPPAGTPTFYGMFYDWQPVYHDPPSNQWFGFQAWSHGAGRRATTTSPATPRPRRCSTSGSPWAIANTTIGAGRQFQIPSTLHWTGAAGGTCNAVQPAPPTPACTSTVAGLHARTSAWPPRTPGC